MILTIGKGKYVVDNKRDTFFMWQPIVFQGHEYVYGVKIV